MLFVLPYATVFNPEDNGGWERIYIWDDIILFLLHFPFVIFWLTYLLIKKGILRLIIKFTLITISFLFFILSAINFVFIAQDFVPHIGALAGILIFPLLILFLILRKQEE